MATTHTFADGEATVSVRGAPAEEERYAYAVVMTVGGSMPVLAGRGLEAAVADALASRRAASWTWIDDRSLAVRFTRRDPEFAARVAADVLDRFERRLADDVERLDDGAFDAALASLTAADGDG